MRGSAYLAEFIGTFFLVLIIAAVIKNDSGAFGPFIIGIGLTGLIYACYHISGSHFNPIVTLGACIAGLLRWSDAPGYIVAQFGAGLSASLLSIYIFNQPVEYLAAETPYLITAEIIGSFGLVFVIFNVAAVKSTKPNSFYGLAIGATVAALAYVFGATSGAAFNPAVAFGLGLIHFIEPSDVWLIIFSNLIGGVIATFAYINMNNPLAGEKEI